MSASPHPLVEDFRKFLFALWKFLGLPDPTPVQYDIAYFLQHGPRRKIIMAFRGVGKSWITAAFVIWKLFCNINLKCLVVSASGTRADNFSTFVKHILFEWEVVKHLYPSDEQRTANPAFDVKGASPDQAPSVASRGITGQLTGSRADLIVADDVEIPKNSMTQLQRDKLAEQVKEFDAIIKPGGEIVYLGTPQTEMSIYNELMKRGYVAKIWPAEVPNEKQRMNYGGTLAEMIQRKIDEGVPAKTPVDPLRFDELDLQERRVSYGRSGFALQFMLDTRLSDADKYPLKLHDLIVYPLDPEKAPVDMAWAGAADYVLSDLPNVGMPGDNYHAPMLNKNDMKLSGYKGRAMFIDPSGRGKDETAWCVLYFMYGRVFLMAAGAFAGGYDEDTVLVPLAKLAEKWKVTDCIAEDNFGDGMFTQLLTPVMARYRKCNVEGLRVPNVQKEIRCIDALEPLMNSHRLVVDPRVIEADYDSAPEGIPEERRHQYSLFYQMTRITREKGALAKDDRIDVLGMGVKWYIDLMAIDTEKSRAREDDKALEDELKKMKKAIGRGSGMNTSTKARPQSKSFNARPLSQ